MRTQQRLTGWLTAPLTQVLPIKLMGINLHLCIFFGISKAYAEALALLHYTTLPCLCNHGVDRCATIQSITDSTIKTFGDLTITRHCCNRKIMIIIWELSGFLCESVKLSRSKTWSPWLLDNCTVWIQNPRTGKDLKRLSSPCSCLFFTGIIVTEFAVPQPQLLYTVYCID